MIDLLRAFPDVKVEVEDTVAMTFRDGKLVEDWDSWNLGLLQQRLRTAEP